MAKNSVYIFGFALLLVVLSGSSSLAVPPGLDLSNYEPVVSAKEARDQTPTLKTPNRQIGDSLYVLCDLNVIYFGNEGGSD